MMKIKIAVIALGLLLFGNLSPQTQGQPRTIEFSKLSDYVNDWDKRRDGERLVVDVGEWLGPLTYERRRNIYSFSSKEPGDVGSTFFITPTLAKSLRRHLEIGDYGSLLIYCILVQFVGDQDVYRSPFVTKVEGFDGHGRIAWTAAGPPPAKVKMPQ